MSQSRWVRSESGLLEIRLVRYTIPQIGAWRRAEFDAGRPSGLRDFYVRQGICPDCHGEGVRMIGWSNPRNPEEAEAARSLGVQQLPFYGPWGARIVVGRERSLLCYR